MPVAGGQHREIRTVQALRACACLLVVAYHALDAWGARQSPVRTADSLWPNGAAGVDLFFVISGFVMATSAARLAGGADAWRFARRRLRRVAPLYWLMTAAKLAALAVSGAATLPGAWQIVASLLFIPVRDAAGIVRPVLGVGWTLDFEMLFYALFAVAVWRRPRGSTLRLLLLCLIPLALAGFFRRPDWPAPFALANGLVLEFCLGMAVAGWMPAGRAHSMSAALLASGAMLLILPQPGPWRFALWGLPAAAALAGAARLEPRLGPRVPAWLLGVGEASFAIYLLHPFLVPALARLLPPQLPPGLAFPVLVTASLLVSTAGGVLLHRWVDRPVQARLAAWPVRPTDAAIAARLGAA